MELSHLLLAARRGGLEVRQQADERRFIGNLNRNAFRRLWWRAEILGPDVPLDRLGEDELVNIMERPTITGDRRLARVVAAEFLRRVDGEQVVDRTLLMREAMKRLLRLTPFVSMEALDDGEVENLVRAVFDSAVSGLAGRHASIPLPPPEVPPAPSPLVTRVERDVAVTVSHERSNGGRARPDEEALEPAGEVAVDIARKTGRVTNMTLREVAPISSAEAREVLQGLVAAGRLVRRGEKRGTHYVLPEDPVTPEAPAPPARRLRWGLPRNPRGRAPVYPHPRSAPPHTVPRCGACSAAGAARGCQPARAAPGPCIRHAMTERRSMPPSS